MSLGVHFFELSSGNDVSTVKGKPAIENNLFILKKTIIEER